MFMKIPKNKTLERFKKIAAMNYDKRSAVIDKEPLERLEKLICSALHHGNSDEEDTYHSLILRRYARLRKKWTWTPENIQRVLAVSKLFSDAWEKAFVQAKNIIDTLYGQAENKAAFLEDYRLDITLEPGIWVQDTETGEWDIQTDTAAESVIYNFKYDVFLVIMLTKNDYNPETRDESGFRENINIKRDLNWNIDGVFDGFEDEDGYICFSVYELVDNNWAIQDVVQINRINIHIEFKQYDYIENYIDTGQKSGVPSPPPYKQGL
jgi:hypothetical protein